MARLMKDCFCCSLKSAMVFIAAYTIVIALLILIFNINDVIVAGSYILWGRITSLVFSGLLIFASLCLLRGTTRDRGDLMGIWLIVFFIYTIFSLTNVAYNIHYYRNGWVPVNINNAVLADMVIFGILFFVDILCLMAVYSQRQHLGGFQILP